MVGDGAAPSLSDHDLDSAVQQVGHDWRHLAGARVLISGGTGFVGRWLVETLARARKVENFSCTAVLLTRCASRTYARWPWVLGQGWISLLETDVRRVGPDAGSIDLVVHGAVDTGVSTQIGDIAEVCESGTRRMIEIAQAANASRFHLISSGAVYASRQPGQQDPAESDPISTSQVDSGDAYADGKRIAERLVSAMSSNFRGSATISRVFGLIGPALPLDGRFAVGNFIRDALQGEPIRVLGDGRAVRSYLHSIDLAAWIWKMAIVGAPGTVMNVGSGQAISIGDLAHRVRDLLAPTVPVLIQALPGVGTSRFVPNIDRAWNLFGLRPLHSIEDGILGTARHYHGTS